MASEGDVIRAWSMDWMVEKLRDEAGVASEEEVFESQDGWLSMEFWSLFIAKDCSSNNIIFMEFSEKC